MVNFNSINYKEHNFKSASVKFNYDSLYSQFKKNNFNVSNFKPNQIQVSTIDKSFSNKLLKTNSNYSFNNSTNENESSIDYNNIENIDNIDNIDNNYKVENKINIENVRACGSGSYIGDNVSFGVAFKNDQIKVGDILYHSTEDEPYLISEESKAAIVTRIKHGTVDSPGEIEIEEQTVNGPVTKVYVLESYDEITNDFDRYIREDPKRLVKDELTAKYKEKWIQNAGLKIVNGIYSIFAMKKNNNKMITIGQVIIKNVMDEKTGGDNDLSLSELGSQIAFSTFSSSIWILADHKDEFLPQSVSESLSSKGGNAALTGVITATLDFSNSILSGRNDAYLKGEEQYAKQYEKAKFSSDLEGNIFDIVGAAILDFFAPGVGSWIGGPILNGIKELSYCSTEYYLELNGLPVPSRPSEAYDNFTKKRVALVALKNSALDLYKEKCKMYSKDSLEYKNATIEYVVDKNGYGNISGIKNLINITCGDSKLIDIPYSKENSNISFGVNEDWYNGKSGLNSYGFVEWVIHNAGYKINLDSLQENGMGIFIGENASFGVEYKNDKIEVGDILYCSTEDEPYLISSESRTAIITKIKHGTVDSPGEIEIVEQTENGPVTKVYTMDSFDEITGDFDRYISMDDYYDDIEDNVDYSRKDIQETISMINEMENNE